MSRTYRRTGPHREYLKDKWYKYQEERRAGKGVWTQAVIKNQHSSNRIKVRMAAQKGEGLVDNHHTVER